MENFGIFGGSEAFGDDAFLFDEDAFVELDELDLGLNCPRRRTTLDCVWAEDDSALSTLSG